MARSLTFPQTPSGGRPRPLAGSALVGLCVVVTATGATLTLYAMLGLPSNDHSGMTALRGWTQFLLAAGIPSAGAVGVVGASRFRRGRAGPRPALFALAAALLCAGGWTLVFFDWSG